MTFVVILHLADAFIQSDLQEYSHIQVIHLLSVCVFPGNWTHNICAANAMLYHWATGTLVCDSHRLAKICSEQCLEICITSTPCDCLPLYNVLLIVFLNCKSLWIKASAKLINVNVTFPLTNVIRLKPICFLSQGMLVGLLILQVIIYRSRILAIIFNQRNICVYL